MYRISLIYALLCCKKSGKYLEHGQGKSVEYLENPSRHPVGPPNPHLNMGSASSLAHFAPALRAHSARSQCRENDNFWQFVLHFSAIFLPFFLKICLFFLLTSGAVVLPSLRVFE